MPIASTCNDKAAAALTITEATKLRENEHTYVRSSCSGWSSSR